ncbi:MAG: T9SS type A sorting domain-containing protein, partial [Chitinophagaceae bacterium]|nr:T9SS type A sorting domain-containing protein [Chitinophagaceae bacterium]
NPHLVGYAESHDEERIMYKNLQFGNSSGSYNIRDLNTALKRSELTTSFLLTMPGPKMIWQFGEMGYDYSINTCVNGTVNNNCRLDNKPVRWDYLQVIQRQRLYDINKSLLALRENAWYKDVFIANNINLTRSMGGAIKWMIIRSATDSSDLCIVGNFDVTSQSANVTFPIAGTWYDYLQGGTFSATGTAQNITLQPGEFHVYLNRNLTNAVVTPVTGINNPGNGLLAVVYPNPATDNSILEITIPATGKVQVDLWNSTGQQIKPVFSGNLAKGKHQIILNDKINNLPPGIYLLKVNTAGQSKPVKLMIQ